MNLLDKYIHEIGKHLPAKNRLDLQTEIRSTIEDMLEDRSKSTGKAVDEALVSEVLAEYGAPQKVAAAYKPARYLIGPRLYPFFEMVVKIVFSVLTVVMLIGFAINFFAGNIAGEAFLVSFGKLLLDYITGMISAFGNIVLVFAILERVLPASEFTEEEEKWTPADLNAEPDPDAVKRVETIFEILFTLLGLAVLNLYPDIIGFAMIKDSTWVYVPGLSETFFRYLPWINLLGGLQIILDLYLIRQGVWQNATRLIRLGLEVAGMALVVAMLLGPSLVSVNLEAISGTLGASSETIKGLIQQLPKLVLVIVLIIQGFEIVEAAWSLIKSLSPKKVFLPK